MSAISGFDMGPTIRWYERMSVTLLNAYWHIPPPAEKKELGYPLSGEEYRQLGDAALASLLDLFPEPARSRSILWSIEWRPPRWFHKDSALGQPRDTGNPSEALSPTAIIPSFTDYAEWKKRGVPACTLVLHQIHGQACSEEVRRIIHSQGCIHEAAHSIVAPALFINGYSLRLPDGRLVDGFDYIMEFGSIAECHPPISHYAGAHRGKENKFQGDPPYNLATAVSEELAESITAFLLGFAFCRDEEYYQRNLNPFADRPEIREFVINFLEASLT